MPRISGVNIPDQKQIETALTYIYGIGKFTSQKILEQAKIKPQTLASKLAVEEVSRIQEIIKNKGYQVEGDLKRERLTAVKRLKDIGCWKGTRHIKGLPVRGQRTGTNSRTVRGNVRRTVGSGRKLPPTAK